MKRFPVLSLVSLFCAVMSSSLLAVPRITVDPLQIGNELFTGEYLEYDIEIGNEGDDQLQFAIEIEYLGHDDGWLEVDPPEAQVDPDGTTNLTVSFNWPGEYFGEYYADIIILSNDPENGEVRIEFRLDMNSFVATEWSEDFGFPDEINWNAGNDNLFTGQDYETTLELLVVRNRETIIAVDLSVDNEFFSIDPEYVEMEFEERAEITVTLNADQDGLHEEWLMITSRMILEDDEESIPFVQYIPLSAETVTLPIDIRLERGWNMISAPFEPEDRNIVSIFSELAETGSLIMVKDNFGRFYYPRYNHYNNIPFWDFRQAYQLKMAEAEDFTMTGEAVPVDTPFDLSAGWNSIAFLPPVEIEVNEALRSVLEVLSLVKNGQGNFFAPDYDFNNMPPLQRGSGYQINVARDVQFIWNVPE